MTIKGLCLFVPLGFQLDKLESDRPWISREKAGFGVDGSEWDFDASELDLRQSQKQ